jgi:hypothetical protein
LVDAIRQLAIDYPQWEGGPAHAMLEYHSRKLWDIQQYAISRKQLVLHNYTYLRDLQVKEFHHKAMTGALWEWLGDLTKHTSPVVPGGKPQAPDVQAAEGGADTKCSHCAVKELQRLANVPGQRNFSHCKI